MGAERFIDDITHRMKVTLTYMRGFASMLPLDGPLTPDQTRDVEKILKGIGDLANMVEEMISWSEAGPAE